MDARPVGPSRATRDLMLTSEDVAAAVLLVASLPQRALIEEIMIRPTHVRDQSKEVRRAD